MKNFLSDCKKHEKAKSHMGAYKTWKTYGFQPRIDCLMSQTRREEIQRHNEEVDEATDVSTQEQLSVIVRMDKGESVIERQLGFVDVSCDRTATAISSVVKGWDDETLSKVTGLLGYLNGFLFCFLVHVCQRILEQSSILYSILQDKDTDFHYGMSRFERFKAFVASLRNDTEYCQVYDLAVEKVGPPVTSSIINLVFQKLKINGVLSITSASVQRISIHKDILSEKEDANTLHDEVVKKFIEKPRRLAFLYK
ncbi:uncharacterized protein LOC124457382 isoform X1 [Xenia sp. Carnegie-2017]|uniref:uncharacterized protein LOC124457382 isoform X1 n=1 Tax=Xenia sp. Carnegie-2017 TaxID=2897299 RepID=UPI001F036AFF|nr:uncharacterized protein LOC124457382 isoform X1 [Xenia sp. Carnegie-2017]